MNQDPPKAPGEAEGDGRAVHGPATEVTWDGGKGRQPYENQEPSRETPAAAGEVTAGNRGAASGRNQDQLEQVKRKP